MLPDNDEELLEAFLNAQLPIEAASQTAARLQTTPAFRSHFRDMLTMRSLLQPGMHAVLAKMMPDCAVARELFHGHRNGAATALDLARVSLHLAACRPCDLACNFGGDAPGGAVGGDGGRWYAPRSARGRGLFLAGVLVVVGLGGAGWRFATMRAVAPMAAPATGASTATVAPEALAALIRRLRAVDATKPYADVIEELPTARDARARNRLYGKLMNMPRVLDEEAMWTIADAEPDAEQRKLTYSLATPPTVRNADRWLAALKRERAEGVPGAVDSLAALMVYVRPSAGKPFMMDRLAEAAVREWGFAIQVIVVASVVFPDDPDVNAAIDQLARSSDPGIATFALREVAHHAKTIGDTARVRSAVREISAYLASPEVIIRKVAAECVESLAPDDMIIGLFKGANVTDEILRETLRAIADRRKITIPID